MTYRKNLYGYRIVSGEIALVPDEKAVVERIAGLYIAGASYQTIADSLNKAGTPFSSEAPLWNKHKVKRLLENPRYTGTKGYPAILDGDTFHAVQAQIRAKTEGYTLKEKRPALMLKESALPLRRRFAKSGRHHSQKGYAVPQVRRLRCPCHDFG